MTENLPIALGLFFISALVIAVLFWFKRRLPKDRALGKEARVGVGVKHPTVGDQFFEPALENVAVCKQSEQLELENPVSFTQNERLEDGMFEVTEVADSLNAGSISEFQTADSAGLEWVLSSPDFEGLSGNEESYLGEFLEQLSQEQADEGPNEDVSSAIGLLGSSSQGDGPTIKSNSLLRLVCLRRGNWSFGLVPSQNAAVRQLTQGGKILECKSGIWFIDDFRSLICGVDGSCGEFTLSFESLFDSITLFKLLTNGRLGKSVSRISEGEYIALVPSSWRRAESISGSAIFEPERVFGNDLSVHYFSIGSSMGAIAFEREDGSFITVSNDSPLFELSGHAIVDDHEFFGPLFGKKLPMVTFPKPELLERGSVLRLTYLEDLSVFSGEILNSDDFSLSEMLPSASSGRFQVALLNSSGKVLYRQVFRFCRTLERISRPPFGILNEENSLSDWRLALWVEHSGDASVCLSDSSTDRYIVRVQGAGSEILTTERWLDPLLSFNMVEADNVSVPLLIMREQLWWSFVEGPDGVCNWISSPLVIPSHLLKASSKAGVAVKLPTSRWVSAVEVIISETSKRKIAVRVNDEVVTIPLRELCDFAELELPGSYDLLIAFERLGRRYQQKLGVIKVACTCRVCGQDAENFHNVGMHFVEAHGLDAFEMLPAERTSELAKGVPDGIYYCDYCQAELVLKYFASPETILQRHLEYSCAARPTESIELPRLVRSKADFVKELSSTRVCKFCRAELDVRFPEDMAAHLLASHKNKVFRLRS